MIHSDIRPLVRSKCCLCFHLTFGTCEFRNLRSQPPASVLWQLCETWLSPGHPVTLHLQVVQGEAAIVHTEPLSLEMPELSRQVFLMS